MLSGGETTVGLSLNGRAHLDALANDTGGGDGQEEIAGRLLAPDSVITRLTLTHVNEFRALLIEAEITPSR